MFPSLIQMCARRLDHPRNLDCICADQKTLMCGASPRRDVQRMIAYCLNHCGCGQGTTRFRDPRRYTKVLDYKLNPAGMPGDRVVPNPYGTSFDNRYGTGGSIPVNVRTCDLGNGQQRSCCSKTCTAVNRDCDWFFEGDCKCYAPPAGLFYWFSGLCGSVHHLPKRDLAQQRRSFYLNATARFASTAAPALPSDLAAQLASGLLPSPCNASYVSFACADSTDGIVHEPPKNWLGALLPEGAKAPPPPVPEEFLRIHGGGEGKLQVVVE
ncbi:hypothetical protein MMC22_003983 [Lobaria immixta]|nr:hypothetical protein [Lobaria immixta]